MAIYCNWLGSGFICNCARHQLSIKAGQNVSNAKRCLTSFTKIGKLIRHYKCLTKIVFKQYLIINAHQLKIFEFKFSYPAEKCVEQLFAVKHSFIMCFECYMSAFSFVQWENDLKSPQKSYCMVVFANEARISTERKHYSLMYIYNGAYVAHNIQLHEWMFTYFMNAYLYTKPKFIHL